MRPENVKKLQNCEMEILDEVARICEKHQISYFIVGGNLIGAIRHKGFIPWDDDMDIAMIREDYDKFLEVASKEINDKFVVDYIENNPYYYLPFAKVRIKDSLYEEPVQVNYQGLKGIWIDIFPLDNANKENSLVLKIQAFLKEGIHFVNAVKADVSSEKYPLFKKIIKFMFKPISIKRLTYIQTKIMKWNKNSEARYCISFGSRYSKQKETVLKTVFLPTVKLEYEGRKYAAPKDYEFYLERIYGDYTKIPPEEKRITHNPTRIRFPGEEELKPEEM